MSHIFFEDFPTTGFDFENEEAALTWKVSVIKTVIVISNHLRTPMYACGYVYVYTHMYEDVYVDVYACA